MGDASFDLFVAVGGVGSNELLAHHHFPELRELERQPDALGHEANVHGFILALRRSRSPPNAFGRRPNAFGRRPNAFGRRPNAFGRRPNAFGRRPNAFGRRPNALGR
jgi:hypothetical protein